MPSHLPAAAAYPHPSVSAPAPGLPPRDPTLDLARVSITLLVIAHHAVLAYHPYAPPAGTFTRDSLIWGAFPVLDSARATGLDGFTLWNDTYFMAMMFLLSGLFVPSSLERKGAGAYVRDRLLRLGVPFVVASAILAPLAYLPAYWLRAEATGNPGFWNAWLALGVWPSGPAWFLWVLLGFGGIAAALHAVAPRVLAPLHRLGNACREHPVRACLLLGLGAVLVYLPIAQGVSPFTWFTWGPFTVQTSRIALYALYFAFGYALGTGGGLGALTAWLAPTAPLARRWWVWQTAAGVVFVGFVAAFITWLISAGKGTPAPIAGIASTVLFALTGAVTTFALLAGFARWSPRCLTPIAWLAPQAFGMYLLHYPIVTWLQYLLLPFPLPGLAKAAVVTTTAVLASWTTTAALRRLPGFARVL